MRPCCQIGAARRLYRPRRPVMSANTPKWSDSFLSPSRLLMTPRDSIARSSLIARSIIRRWKCQGGGNVVDGLAPSEFQRRRPRIEVTIYQGRR